jgi:hypothetical protein
MTVVLVPDQRDNVKIRPRRVEFSHPDFAGARAGNFAINSHRLAEKHSLASAMSKN